MQRGVTSPTVSLTLLLRAGARRCQVHQGDGSAELTLPYKLPEVTEVDTSAIKFPYIFVAWVNNTGQRNVVVGDLQCTFPVPS